MFLQLGPHRAHQRGRTRVCALRRLTSLTRAPGDLTVPLVPFIVFSPLALSRCVLRGRQHYELPVTTDKCVHVVYYRRRRGLRRRGRLGRRPGIFEWGNLSGSRKRYKSQSGPLFWNDPNCCSQPVINCILNMERGIVFAFIYLVICCFNMDGYHNWLCVGKPLLCLRTPWCREAAWPCALKYIFRWIWLSIHANIYPQREKWKCCMSTNETKSSIPEVNVTQFYFSAVWSEVWLYVFGLFWHFSRSCAALLPHIQQQRQQEMGSDPPVDGRRARGSSPPCRSTNTAPVVWGWVPVESDRPSVPDHSVARCRSRPQRRVCFGDVVSCVFL